MNNAIAMAAPAVFELLDIVRERLPGQRWDPVTRPRPTSAFAEIYPAMWAAMANGQQPMTHDDFQSMTAYYRLAFLNMQLGSASEETWDCLALGANMALVLAEQGFGQEWVPRIQEAQDGLLRARSRGSKLGSLRLDGPGLAAMADTLDVLEEQLTIATRAEVLHARDIVLERIDAQSAALNLMESE